MNNTLPALLLLIVSTAAAQPDIAVSPTRVVVTTEGSVQWYDKDRNPLGQTEINDLFSELGAENPQPAQVIYNAEGDIFVVAAVEDRSDRHEVIYTAAGQPGDWITQAAYVTTIGDGIHNLSLATNGDGVMFTFDFDPEISDLGCWVGTGSKDRLTNPALGIINFSKQSSIPRNFISGGSPLVSTTLDSGAFQSVWITGQTPGGYMASNWLQLPLRVNTTPIETCYTDGETVWIAHTVTNGDYQVVQWYEIDLRAWPGSGPKPILANHGMIDAGDDASDPDLAVDPRGVVMFAFLADDQVYTEPGGVLRDSDIEPAIAADPSKHGRYYVYSDGLDVVQTPLPADLNGDGRCDSADLGMLIAAWGSDSGVADLNGDGTVDSADLGILIGGM